MSDTTDSERDNIHGRQRRSSVGASGTDPACPVPHTDGREMINTVIHTDVDSLFNMLFSDSQFFRNFHRERRTTGIVLTPWEKQTDGDSKVRKVSLVAALNGVVGPKECHVTETQALLPVSQAEKLYVVEVEAVNAKIPYADRFYVTNHVCLTKVSANETRYCVYSELKYKKSVNGFIKGMIESNTWSGLKEFYSHMERALQEECRRGSLRAQSVAGLNMAGMVPNRRVRTGRPRRPAPSIPEYARPASPIPSNDTNIGLLARILGFLFTQISERPLIFTVFIPLVLSLLFFNTYLYLKLANIESSYAALSSLSKVNQSFGPSLIPTTQKPTEPPRASAVPSPYSECLKLLAEQEDLSGRESLDKQRWKRILNCTVLLLAEAQRDLSLHAADHLRELNNQDQVRNTGEQADGASRARHVPGAGNAER